MENRNRQIERMAWERDIGRLLDFYAGCVWPKISETMRGMSYQAITRSCYDVAAIIVEERNRIFDGSWATEEKKPSPKKSRKNKR